MEKEYFCNAIYLSGLNDEERRIVDIVVKNYSDKSVANIARADFLAMLHCFCKDWTSLCAMDFAVKVQAIILKI